MTVGQSASVKHRKMAAGQEAAQPGGRSAVRALRIGLARAARDVFDLSLAVIGATQSRCAQAILARTLGEGRMLLLLDGPDALTGAVAVDRDSLSAIIQQQTTGKLTTGEVAERAFTSTDAALVAPLIDAALQRAAAIADILPDKRCLTGYRFGARAEDMRSLLLAIESERFRIFDLTLEFGGGVRQGRWCLALPEPEMPAAPDGDIPSGPRLDRVAGAARAELSAVIGHLRLPLADLARMRPGDLLPLHTRHLDRADLIAINGERIASARLGQIGGMRALRLNETAERTMPRPEGEFHAGPLPQSAAMGGMSAAMPSLSSLEEAGAMPMDMAMGMPSLPTLPDIGGGYDDALTSLSPAQAALEISELAGLSLDETDES